MATTTETESKSEGTSSSKPPNSRSTSSSSRLVEKLTRMTPTTSPKLNGVAAPPTADSASERSPGNSTKHSPVIGAQLSKQSSPIELPASAIQAPTPQKPKNSLQRMFSRTGKKDGSTADTTPALSSAPTPVNGERSSTERQHVNGAEKKLEMKPPSKKNSIAEESASFSSSSSTKPVTNGKDKSKELAMMKRFDVLADGNHTHHLKSAKRQEKLTDMFRDLLLGKKRDEFHDHDNLNLVSSWVEQLKADKDKLAADKKGGPNASSTLVEKYGKCHEVVGRGAFGIVRISHKADIEGKEQLYAVKEFRRRPQESAKRYNKRLTSEFCISSSLRHPNVIHTLDLLQDSKGDYCEVMEYCAGGDLYTLILSAGKLDCAEADCYFKQLMRGVEYMHEMGVAHRDLKPENLLLTSRGALKITDFGNGECFRMAWEKEAHKTCGLCGSAPYISPEEYIEKEFDPRAVDVWATGVIYMAMRTGRHLWRVAKREEDEFFQKYLEGRKDEAGYGPIESLHRARCRNVIYSILDPNPTRRITASQVLKSEWGREIRVCQAGEEGDNPSVRNHQHHQPLPANQAEDVQASKQVKA
ncbi:hypothetical protein H072_8659 [Dactylellina haptotyla CBS 200.50]|uniref:non-specific serine/threonine protein kinase n=1 Tax=Dactylellina haptotyla (strain CBS 200.50) TaxID=1284197 RepID=S8A980_DACHA|nr:hypothetical protein H072_8659 [Dactylellina haptotyla CBS 200.50]